jgi:UDP-N-acetylglucosamine 2-epimerase (non-hydrolysing)
MKILSVLGTRPEAIKMAPIIKKLREFPDITSSICITSQHQEMLNSVLRLFDIKPDYTLNVMRPNQTLSLLTERILRAMDSVLLGLRPDLILVQGDTSTAFVAALSAFYHHVPIAHVEAGLRSHNLNAPWPEEANRKWISACSRLHFAPTLLAKQNLLREGIAAESIHVTGNTIIDALLETIAKLNREPDYQAQLKKQFGFLSAQRRMILITGHRRESFGQGFQSICHALKKIAQQCPEVDLVYPVHLNPNVRDPVYSILDKIDNIYLLAPVDYLAFVYLMQSAYFILTDSGGIQEEAPSLNKPVLIMRENTERMESIALGAAKIIGTEEASIIQHVTELLNNKNLYHSMSQAKNPYGDGHAAEHIAAIIRHYFFAKEESIVF